MKKRFRIKRKNKKIIIGLIILLGLLIINNTPKTKMKDNIIFKRLFNNINNINNSDLIIKSALSHNNKTSTDIKGDYMVDPDPTSKSKKPIVYIYNTHQTEAYNKDIATAYNISPTVLTVSYMLRERLEKLGVSSIVETNKISDVLNNHNWIYKDSYKASRILLERAYEENPSLKVFIDVHRDSAIYSNTTYQDSDKTYAKLLLVVGLDYDGYEANLNNAIKLGNIIKSNNENIYRGIYKKSGSGVNGIYNQDFKENTFLVEVGGQYNSIEEVKNAVDILAICINEYLKENIYESQA